MNKLFSSITLLLFTIEVDDEIAGITMWGKLSEWF